jgi:hypothetical protein
MAGNRGGCANDISLNLDLILYRSDHRVRRVICSLSSWAAVKKGYRFKVGVPYRKRPVPFCCSE